MLSFRQQSHRHLTEKILDGVVPWLFFPPLNRVLSIELDYIKHYCTLQYLHSKIFTKGEIMVAAKTIPLAFRFSDL